MYVMAVVSGAVGLACMSFALHNALKPNTKLEKNRKDKIACSLL